MTLMQRRRVLMAVKKGGGKSDMHGWTDGVKYTDIDLYQNKYWNNSNGSLINYNGWNATYKIPCDGAASITIPAYNGVRAQDCLYNVFFNRDTFIGNFQTSISAPTTVTVPENATHFGLSCKASVLADVLATGVVPHA